MPRLTDEQNTPCRAVTFDGSGIHAADVLRETADWIEAAGRPIVDDIVHHTFDDGTRERWSTTIYLDDQRVSESEAAEAVGVTRSRVSQWRREGRLTAIGEHGPLRYWVSDVRACAASVAREVGRPRTGARSVAREE